MNKKAMKCEDENPVVSIESRVLNEILDFITKLDCQYEMYESMSPLYSKNAEERKRKIEKLREQVKENAMGKVDLKKVRLLSGYINEVNKYYASLETLKQSTLIMFVSKYDEYISNIISIIYNDKKALIRSTNKVYTIAELSAFTSYDAIFESAIKEEIDRIGYASHKDQLDELNTKHKLGLYDDISLLDVFIEACERRNLYVHSGGCVSKKYLDNSRKYNFAIDKDIKEGQYLSINGNYLKNAYKSFLEVGVVLVLSLFRREYPESKEYLDSFFNQEIGYKYLEEEKWDIAELLYRYANRLDRKYLSSETYYYMYLINYCISLFNLGKKNEVNELIAKCDFSALEPSFKLAKLVLLEKYQEAGAFMIDISKEEINDSEYSGWPLFLHFRETEYFKASYKKIFKKDYLVTAIKAIEGGEIATITRCQSESEEI